MLNPRTASKHHPPSMGHQKQHHQQQEHLPDKFICNGMALKEQDSPVLGRNKAKEEEEENRNKKSSLSSKGNRFDLWPTTNSFIAFINWH